MSNQTSDMASLDRRIRLLEEECRKLRGFKHRAIPLFFFVVTSLAIAGLAGARHLPDNKQIFTEDLILMDKQNNVRARFYIDPELGPMLTFFDGGNKLRLQIKAGLDTGDPSIYLRGKSHQVGPDRKEVRPTALLEISNGNPSLSLGSGLYPVSEWMTELDDKGTPATTFNMDNKAFMSFSIDPTNMLPYMIMRDAEGKPLTFSPEPPVTNHIPKRILVLDSSSPHK